MCRLSALAPIMIAFLLGSVECRAQSATAETFSPPILPAKTPVILRLKKSVYKRDAKAGWPLEFEVAFDVVVNGQVFIQSGTAVDASIREVDRVGNGSAKVLIDLGPTQTITGETVRLVGPGATTASYRPGVADSISLGAEAGPALPVIVVMSLFEKEVLLDIHAGCGFGSLRECGVWVMARVAENVALDPAKLKQEPAPKQTPSSEVLKGGLVFLRLVFTPDGRADPRIR